MIKKLNTFWILSCAFLIFSSCQLSDCKEIACTTPPSPLLFQIVDQNNMDRFVLDTSAAHLVEIHEFNTGKPLSVSRFFTEEVTLFQIDEIGFTIGNEHKDYKLIIDQQCYPFIYLTEDRTVECCSLLGDLIEFTSDSFEVLNGDNWHILMIK